MTFTNDGTRIPTAPYKDPDGVMDYGADWSQWLEDGEAINQSNWTVPDDLTEDSSDIVGAVAKVTLSGGTPGQRHLVANRVVTSLGRTEERSMYIFITDK